MDYLNKVGYLYDFVKESNKIEGIVREPLTHELEASAKFIHLTCTPTITDLEEYVNYMQPNAKLRIKQGMDVIVGRHIPPRGGPEIKVSLESLLNTLDAKTPYEVHVVYETLHPFTDGNGRSGRILWAWQMNKLGRSLRLGFLHTFYYQALDGSQYRS